MKFLMVIFTFTFLAVMNVSIAAPTVNLTDLRKMNNLTTAEIRTSIIEVRNVLEQFNLSKGDINIREQEAQVYLELALKTIKVDETGDAEAFLFHTYNSDKKAFNRALNKMDQKKAASIRYTIDQAGKSLKQGQDSVE